MAPRAAFSCCVRAAYVNDEHEDLEELAFVALEDRQQLFRAVGFELLSIYRGDLEAVLQRLVVDLVSGAYRAAVEADRPVRELLDEVAGHGLDVDQLSAHDLLEDDHDVEV